MNKEELQKILQEYPDAHLFETVASQLGSEMEMLCGEIKDFISKSDQTQGIAIDTPILLFSFENSFQAYCNNKSSFGEISISKEVIFLFYHLSYTFMRHKNFMPHIGDSEKEESFVLELSSAPRKSEVLGENIIKPNCPIRRMYSHYLFKFMVFYVVGHELAHIRRGHFTIPDTIDVIGISGFEITELDADSVSIDLISFYFKHISNNLDRNHPASWMFESYENANDLLSISVKITSLMFSLDKKWLKKLDKVHYPPAPARDFNLATQLGLTLSIIYDKNLNEQFEVYAKLSANFYGVFFEFITNEFKGELKNELITFLRSQPDYLNLIPKRRRTLNDILGGSNFYNNINIPTES